MWFALNSLLSIADMSLEIHNATILKFGNP